jgi:hypothetical protein
LYRLAGICGAVILVLYVPLDWLLPGAARAQQTISSGGSEHLVDDRPRLHPHHQLVGEEVGSWVMLGVDRLVHGGQKSTMGDGHDGQHDDHTDTGIGASSIVADVVAIPTTPPSPTDDMPPPRPPSLQAPTKGNSKSAAAAAIEDEPAPKLDTQSREKERAATQIALDRERAGAEVAAEGSALAGVAHDLDDAAGTEVRLRRITGRKVHPALLPPVATFPPIEGNEDKEAPAGGGRDVGEDGDVSSHREEGGRGKKGGKGGGGGGRAGGGSSADEGGGPTATLNPSRPPAMLRMPFTAILSVNVTGVPFSVGSVGCVGSVGSAGYAAARTLFRACG